MHLKLQKKIKTDTTWHFPECAKIKSECTCYQIHQVSEIKYLGLVLSHNLNWSDHSIYLQAKIRKGNFLLYYLKKKYLPKSGISSNLWDRVLGRSSIIHVAKELVSRGLCWIGSNRTSVEGNIEFD